MTSDELPGLARVVTAILAHAAAAERAESAARGRQSSLAWVLWCLELGAVIRTTGRDAPELQPVYVPPLPLLGAEVLPTVRAIAEDGQGLAVVPRVLGTRVVAFSFEQRIGWALATDTQRGKWAAKIVSGDSAPALAGAKVLGIERLKALLAEWEKTA